MSSNRKLRPDNGPGANGLRGGRNVYSQKTAVGSWLDEYASSPKGYRRGFTTTDFETEAQHQQIGATLKPSEYYGSAIVPPVRKPETKDSYKSADAKPEEAFKSSYHLMVEDFMKHSATDTKHTLPKANISREQLSTYRGRWTVDSEMSRKLRFQTESNRSNDFLSRQFRVSTTRMLPGTPKVLEILREKVVDKYGILTVAAMRLAVGSSGVQSCESFLSKIKSFGTGISIAEASQLLAYFTPNSEIDVGHFLRVFIGNVNEFSDAVPKKVFGSISSITREEIEAKLNYSTYPEVAEGLKEHLDAYSDSSSGTFTMKDIVQIHCDLFASDPINYNAAVSKIWKL